MFKFFFAHHVSGFLCLLTTFFSFELFCFLVCPCRLAKATLTLIPLFGIHEMIFIFATDEQTTGILRYIKVFFTLTLNSFQVGLIRVCR